MRRRPSPLPRQRVALAPALATFLAVALTVVPAGAARQQQQPDRSSAPGYAEPLFRGLEYRLVGPFRGGRVTAVAGVPGEPYTFYMGATGGGVWKTVDAGLSWRNVSDKIRRDEPREPPVVMGELPEEEVQPPPSRRPAEGQPESRVRPGDEFGSASVGAIAVAPSDPNVVYVGMGSACIRGDVSPGDGIYKSTDGGESWRHMGLPQAGQIAKMAVHPTDPDLVYAAVFGHAFGPNPERGVYRSRDGGRTWRKVLYVSDRAGAIDLVMDPGNSRILYAATWEAVRQPWTMISGGEGSGIFKSTDGGNTWRRLSEGLPEGILGRIGLAVSPARPNRVWALVEHKEKGGLYRSEDGGKSFRLVSSDRNLLQRAWYYTHVYADPKDANTVYVLNVAMWRSDDGGASFLPIRTPHGDNHDLWIDSDDPRIMVEGNDGGANVTLDGGRSWSGQENQPTAEMYRVTVDDQYPYWLYGGQQDNSAVAIPSRAPGGGIARHDWYVPAGCETAWVAVDPDDPDVTYGGCYGGTIGRFDRRLSQEQEVMAYPQMAVGQRAADLEYRFQWNAPIHTSRHDPAVVYHASNHLHRSRDEGMTWEVVSPDLTRDDESKQGYSGGDITWDNTGVEVYGTIFAFAESPQTPGLLWAGSDDGLVHVSRDDGATWQDVTPAGMPEWATVNVIAPSPHDSGRAFLAVHRYRLDDFRPYVFRTDDYGASWQLLTDGRNGIPADHYTRAIVEDPARKGLLYAGTEFGVYVSFDDGRRWQPFQLNLPVAPITHLEVKRDDLVVATHGRSFWILDDLTPLHHLTPEVAAAPQHLLPPRDAYQWEGAGGWGGGGDHAGRNPPYGALIHYTLPAGLDEEGAQEVTLEILDAGGNVLRTLSSQNEEPAAPNPWARFFPEMVRPRKLPAKQGLNRYVWNLRLPDAEVVPTAVLWGVPTGPEVPPGTYQARLTHGDWSSTESFQVRTDPRREVPPEEAQARFALARQVWQDISRAHRALKTIRDVQAQVDGLVGRLQETGQAEGLAESAEALGAKLTAVADELHQSRSQAGQDILNFPPQLDNQLLFLQNVVETAGARPTQGSYERYRDLKAELDRHLAELDRVLATDLAAFNALVAERAAPAVIVPPPPPERPEVVSGG
ncbi:MAG TPA: glycosyl hydrolase [Thermoanaerobaculia bacterium]|nr:glycosyl hydrolase [Thermoanaerobaculia bacterium]